LQPFDYVVPRDFAEASALLAEDGRARALMGGTDLIVRARAGALAPECVVDLKHLPGMREIRCESDGGLTIGAACTMNQVAGHPYVREHYGLLAQACSSVASYQLRNRATVGGNCCNASPAADTAPALYCLQAQARVYGPAGFHCLPIEDFFTGPGRTALRTGEFLVALHLPYAPGQARCKFNKLGRTQVGDIAIVTVAVLAQAAGSDRARATEPAALSDLVWRVALGAVGPTPLRARAAEAALASDTSTAGILAAADLATAAARPITDIRASAAYRTAMVRVLARRGIEAVVAACEGTGL
jgi:CO/xanthine dehydrogenase FAD-binding subunit